MINQWPLGALTLALGISTMVDAQNADERKAVSDSVSAENLRRLSAELQLEFERQEALVLAYLKRHPDQLRTFEKNGSTYYLKRMGPDGNPVYINTKSTQADQDDDHKKNSASKQSFGANSPHGGGSR